MSTNDADVAPTDAETLASQVRRSIVTGELAVGERLPAEQELRERFGVARATLRAALRILESEGLVIVHRGARGGVEVTRPSFDSAARYFGLLLQTRQATLADFQAARLVLEPPLAGLLAKNADEAALTELEAALEAERGEVATEGVSAVHFHALVAKLCGSSSMAVVMGMLDGTIQHLTESRLRSERGGQRRGGHRAHSALLELVRAGDASGAEELWRSHVEEIGTRFLKGDRSRTVDLFE
jgi:DNA-binding FadR family transcriptional regulator